MKEKTTEAFVEFRIDGDYKEIVDSVDDFKRSVYAVNMQLGYNIFVFIVYKCATNLLEYHKKYINMLISVVLVQIKKDLTYI